MSHLRHLTPSNTRTPRTVESGTQIVITRAGILGLMSRLARSGPGGPAQPLQVSRLHPRASCLPCATSPRPTPSRAPAPPHRRTRTEIVITRAGILGLRSRLARSGPGGPAQPLQVSRLHRQASCLTCATSPHPTPSLAPAPPHRRTRTEIVITRAGTLGLRSRLARSGPGGPAQPLQVSRLHRDFLPQCLQTSGNWWHCTTTSPNRKSLLSTTSPCTPTTPKGAQLRV